MKKILMIGLICLLMAGIVVGAGELLTARDTTITLTKERTEILKANGLDNLNISDVDNDGYFILSKEEVYQVGGVYGYTLENITEQKPIARLRIPLLHDGIPYTENELAQLRDIEIKKFLDGYADKLLNPEVKIDKLGGGIATLR